jgi:hypothetical protein
MEDIKFEKTNLGYKVTLTPQVIEAIRGMMIAISNDKLNEYNPYLNEQLEDQLVARYVSSLFFHKEGLNVNENGFILIDTIYDKRHIKVSVGRVMVNDDKYELASGILYNK